MAATDSLLSAIEAGDPERVASLIAHDPGAASAPIPFGEHPENTCPPLHHVCDAVFRGALAAERAAPLAEVLLAAGVDPDQAFAKSGDTYLISAASLGVEPVGLLLVDRGADVQARGLFDATALHWAAIMGLPRLAAALVRAGAEIELRDTRYDCTPLEWALHGWTSGTNGDRGSIPAVVAALVAVGARVPTGAEANLGDDDIALREALRGERKG